MAAEVVEAGVLMALIVAVSTLIYATGVLTNGGQNRDNGVSLTVSHSAAGVSTNGELMKIISISYNFVLYCILLGNMK